MRKSSNLIGCVACIGFLMSWAASTGLAADKMNYSGKYSLKSRNNASGESESTLNVRQNEDSIEVTRLEQGKSTTNRYPLNGTEGDYMSPGGVSGKGKGQLAGKNLVLESFIVTRLQPSAPPVRIHIKEQWQLSADFKTLTIKSDVDFPDFPAEISGIAAAYGPGTQKYTRTENP